MIQTNDVQLAETFKYITKKLTRLDDSTKKITKLFKEAHSEDGKTQTPCIQKVTGTQAIRDTLSFMRRSKN